MMTFKGFEWGMLCSLLKNVRLHSLGSFSSLSWFGPQVHILAEPLLPPFPNAPAHGPSASQEQSLLAHRSVIVNGRPSAGRASGERGGEEGSSLGSDCTLYVPRCL